MEQILDVATPLRGYTLEPDGKRRHEGLVALREQGEFGHPEARALLNRSDSVVPAADPVRRSGDRRALVARRRDHCVRPLGVRRGAAVGEVTAGAARGDRRRGEALSGLRTRRIRRRGCTS